MSNFQVVRKLTFETCWTGCEALIFVILVSVVDVKFNCSCNLHRKGSNC